MDFGKRMQPVLKQSVFELHEQGFIVWCGSMVHGDDGLYYLYFSFWPLEKGHNGWVTCSQIGYAVSESPLGPFEYGGIALSGAGADAWDRDCVHNPAALKHDGKYYIYYMGNYGNGEYWDHRNHQRIGVAFSDHPQGPFRRMDAPVIDVEPGYPDALVVSNPSVAVGPDGRFHMIYKAVSDRDPLPRGGPVLCMTAEADTPLGPFRKHHIPVMANPEQSWSVEDPGMWYENDRFYCLVKDFHGYYTDGKPNGVALFESRDGIDWKPGDCCFAFGTQIHWEDGTVEELANMERLQVLLDDNGKPVVLMCACCRKDDKDKTHSFNVQIGLNDIY